MNSRIRNGLLFDTIEVMKSEIAEYLKLTFIVIFSTFLLWIPFLLNIDSWFGLNFSNVDFATVYQNYDGLLYIVPAKTLYNLKAIANLNLELNLSPIYFAAHLPLYPILIRTLAPLVGFLKSSLLVTLFTSVGFATVFYSFLKAFNLTKAPFILTIIVVLFPRLYVVRSVGSPETLFILLVLSSILFFEKKQYIVAGILGALSVMTKTPGILLGIAYGLVFVERMIKEKSFSFSWLWIGLICVGPLLVFTMYWVGYGDFLAYFHSGDNIHLISPYAVFNAEAKWVGTVWLDDILFYYAFYIFTVLKLWNTRYRSFFYFSAVFLTATLFVQHRDIARYSLPIWPFAVIAFEKFFTSKRFLILSVLLFPGILLYAWNFMLHNYLPVSDWSAFL